jgi:O-antigen/teichoic acid export membrane protein
MNSTSSSLKTLVLRGSAWTFAGHGGGQLIRLSRSLILTRLLFPEAFGLMSLVWAVIYALSMLSDVGLHSAIVRDRRGDDPDFLNTAWTIQVLRGVVLWLLTCVIAGPVAAFYGAPELTRLIPVAGLNVLIGSFSSTSVHTAKRNMEYRRLTLLELSNEVVGFVGVVAWAFFQPTVWALVGGSLISSIFFTVGSHRLLPGARNRFRFEQSSLRILMGFGKWIFLSSVFSLLSNQSDRMLLGRYLSMAQLGVYSIAIMLSEAVQALVLKVTTGVMLPAYGRVVRTDPDRLSIVVDRARLGIDVFLVLPIAALMVLGTWVVDFLYDERYSEAGWMFQILCLRLMMAAVLSNSEACLVALGHPKYAFMQSAFRAVWILVSIPVGWHLLQIHGAVWAIALSEVPVTVVLWAGMARYRMLSLWVEARSVLFALLGAMLGFGLLRLLPLFVRS